MPQDPEHTLLYLFPMLSKRWKISPINDISCIAQLLEFQTLYLSLADNYAYLVLTILSTNRLEDFPNKISLAGTVTIAKSTILTPITLTYAFAAPEQAIIFQTNPPSTELVGTSTLASIPRSYQHAPADFLAAFTAYL